MTTNTRQPVAKRFRTVLVVAFLAAVSLPPTIAAAQQSDAAAYPRQPIKILVGLAPGAINDVQARVIAQKMSDRMGQPVVVENKTGAGGNIAAEFVARAAPDGYTLLVAPTATLVVNPAVYTKLPYSSQQDFVPIVQISTYPLYLAVPAGLPVSSVKELLDYAKANPDKANLGSPATFFDVMTAILTANTGAKFVVIPFKSTPETMTALITGQTMIGFQEYRSLSAQLQAGKVKALAIMSAKRSAELPDVPTITEAGYGHAVAQPVTGVVAPKATPIAIVKRLETEINAILKLPDVQERWKALGLYTVDSTTESFTVWIDQEIKRWSAGAKAANIKLD
jgi:tripartite-type tricarboxylate transporter receptor subunit TctC